MSFSQQVRFFKENKKKIEGLNKAFLGFVVLESYTFLRNQFLYVYSSKS